MAINFDALPSTKPNAIPPKGPYYALIEKAEMKKPKEPGKPMYLNLTLALSDRTGKSCGKVFDIISESDHELIRYKLARLVTALGITLTGNFELKDLCKIIAQKKLIVDITKEEKDGYAPKAVIDIFTNQIFYPLSEASQIFGTEKEENIARTEGLLPFEIDAADAADATQNAQAPTQAASADEY